MVKIYRKLLYLSFCYTLQGNIIFIHLICKTDFLRAKLLIMLVFMHWSLSYKNKNAHVEHHDGILPVTFIP